MRDSGGCRKAACGDGRLALGWAGFAEDFCKMAYPLSCWPLAAYGTRERAGRGVTPRMQRKDSVLANKVERFERGVIFHAKAG